MSIREFENALVLENLTHAAFYIYIVKEEHSRKMINIRRLSKKGRRHILKIMTEFHLCSDSNR